MTSGNNRLADKIHGRRRDLATTKGFPGKPKKKNVEGFGVLGKRTDTDLTTGAALPVIEFRSFNNLTDLAAFRTVALKLFDYVASLNAQGAGRTHIT